MTTTRRLAAILLADVVCWVELRKFWNGQCRLLARTSRPGHQPGLCRDGAFYVSIGWKDEVPIRPLNGKTRQIRTFSVITAQPNMRLNPSDTPLPLYL
jgi:hypothetical protein